MSAPHSYSQEHYLLCDNREKKCVTKWSERKREKKESYKETLRCLKQTCRRTKGERHKHAPAMRLSYSQKVVCWSPPLKHRPDRG